MVFFERHFNEATVVVGRHYTFKLIKSVHHVLRKKINLMRYCVGVSVQILWEAD